MKWIRSLVLSAGIAAIACSPQDETGSEAREGTTTSVPVSDSAAHTAHAMDGETADADEHAGHPAARGGSAEDEHRDHGVATADGSHDEHGAAAVAGQDHAGHEAGRAPGAAEHERHGARPGEQADTSHMAHAAPGVARRMDHAAHGDTARMDHAAHADTAHGARAPMQAGAPEHHGAHGGVADAHQPGAHEMTMISLGGGWMAIGMAQAFPAATMALPADDGTPLGDIGLYVTQPALMVNVESPQSRVSLRTTLNFEGLTQPDGELTFGGWGEGFLDKRHPHTLLHEAMLSVNVWARNGGGFSLSAGKGFAPYGTDDPMSRPVLKYPTNHHLSQILERWTLNAVYSSPRWSVEAGVFGGNEPTSPWDMSNIESFANSWSARVARRFGTGAMGIWEWELSASYGHVVEEHGEGEPAATTQLYNVAFRHEHDHAFGRMYYLTEASLSDPEHHSGYWSLLGEASLVLGAHAPYGRVEYSIRPEYPREGAPGTSDFFRYDHDDEPIGATRWLTLAAGYGLTATPLPFSARPFVEVQWHHAAEEEGDIDPDALFGRSSFASLSAGFRLFLGGEPMRMGSYGVLDSMTLMHRMQMGEAPAAEHGGH